MTPTDSKIDEDEIKRYLFAEADQSDLNEFEERLLCDDKFFFDVADLENRLVDEYVRADLSAADLARFERSIDRIPDRRQKIANARSLYEFIGESSPVAVAEEIPVTQSFWQRFESLLIRQTPTLGYAMGAVLLIFMVSTGVLIFQNQQKNSEIARLEDKEQQQTKLESELDSLRRRETELQSTIDSERDASGDLQDELDRERTRREEIERELGKLKKSNSPQSTGPIIASLMLFPTGGRGGNGGSAPDLTIGVETKRVSIRLALPDDVTSEDRLTVSLNQKVTAKDVTPRISGGKKTISVSFPVQLLVRGKNKLDVTDSDARSVSSYNFNVLNK